MDQRLTFITLGVKDLPMMKTWYQEKFGWTPFKDEAGICFFSLAVGLPESGQSANAMQQGVILALFPAEELAEDVGVEQDGSGFKRFSISINFNSKQELDELAEDLRAKGVRIVRPPENVFWGGYRGYIADPEDNYWELAYNPFLKEEMMK